MRPLAEDGVVIHAPAKLNLFLEVLSKRSDGFHEIETLMCPITWYDTLVFRDEPKGSVRFACEFAVDPTRQGSASQGDVPSDATNLVVRAVELLRRTFGVARGAQLRLVKRIPASAGLAGGSSNAAAALVAANLVWRLGRSAAELAELAAQLGSDVPFFLAGGAAVCRGRGEQITRVGELGELAAVVVRPPVGLTTADVYRACQPATEPRAVQPLLDAWRGGDRRRLAAGLCNRLQGAAETLCPWMQRLRQEFSRLNFDGHQMSGSGTSYFGLCRHRRQARALAAVLRGRGLGQVFAVQGCRGMILQGERLWKSPKFASS
ncbi:MAG: 4-(cytidine 5'-diphospho)-2-C-methyl-D-erythritol kinase [Pirellulales bacterium]|nr:4-(cytidine 5'-diphospho)-2-C-methyl-D-erythritol kinase [Pirellulales bacterium]